MTSLRQPPSLVQPFAQSGTKTGEQSKLKQGVSSGWLNPFAFWFVFMSAVNSQNNGPALTL
ncbi:MAG: hypothetical protein EOM26_01335 [Alphaproteobacteria bacterium]|nr:hypothetical protein [Alphaproteobacteria bacterium]